MSRKSGWCPLLVLSVTMLGVGVARADIGPFPHPRPEPRPDSCTTTLVHSVDKAGVEVDLEELCLWATDRPVAPARRQLQITGHFEADVPEGQIDAILAKFGEKLSLNFQKITYSTEGPGRLIQGAKTKPPQPPAGGTKPRVKGRVK